MSITDRVPEETMDLEWAKNSYLAHLASLIDSNLTYLHSTLTWAITILLGGLGFVVTRSTFPDRFSIAFLAVLMIVLGHFAVRTAKAYLNVARFGSIEKEVLICAVSECDETSKERVRAAVREFHCEWVSPLGLWPVVYKLLFELGFVYFFGIVTALAVYCVARVGVDCMSLGLMGGAIIVLTLEIWLGLVRSAYFHTVTSEEISSDRR